LICGEIIVTFRSLNILSPYQAMLFIQHISLLAAFVGIFNTATPIETKEYVPTPPLFRCGGSGANVKCTIERKVGKKKTAITHFFTTKSLGNNTFELRIEAVINGGTTLVYSSKIYTTDKRNEGKYVIQLQGAKNKNGYSWEISSTDALKATYDLKKKDIVFETVGNMANYYDNSHGLSSASVKSNTTPPNFDVDNVVKAVSAYFIMEYHKAIQQAFEKNKFPL
jgi:hypothetical protein